MRNKKEGERGLNTKKEYDKTKYIETFDGVSKNLFPLHIYCLQGFIHENLYSLISGDNKNNNNKCFFTMYVDHLIMKISV